MSLPKLDLEKDILEEMKSRTPHVSYSLPYVLSSEKMDRLQSLVKSFPVSYALHVGPTISYEDGMTLVLELLDD